MIGVGRYFITSLSRGGSVWTEIVSHNFMHHLFCINMQELLTQVSSMPEQKKRDVFPTFMFYIFILLFSYPTENKCRGVHQICILVKCDFFHISMFCLGCSTLKTFCTGRSWIQHRTGLSSQFSFSVVYFRIPDKASA